MTADSGRRGRATPLTDRHAECGELDRLVDGARAGESPALLIRGDPGVGKTALLEYLSGRAASQGCRVERAAGVQSEMELAFAGLHQLCAPILDRAERLAEPQRDPLCTALGVAAGAPPDRFLVGLAALSLLSEVAGGVPLDLTLAYDMFTAMRMEGFAERTRRELLATGATVRRRTVESPDQLTSQETLIARLASDGLSNAEIAAQLFISARTVEWHLRKVFAKLGVSSRSELPADARTGPGSLPG